jgi:hypothetical protein
VTNIPISPYEQVPDQMQWKTDLQCFGRCELYDPCRKIFNITAKFSIQLLQKIYEKYEKIMPLKKTNTNYKTQFSTNIAGECRTFIRERLS